MLQFDGCQFKWQRLTASKREFLNKIENNWKQLKTPFNLKQNIYILNCFLLLFIKNELMYFLKFINIWR